MPERAAAALRWVLQAALYERAMQIHRIAQSHEANMECLQCVSVLSACLAITFGMKI